MKTKIIILITIIFFLISLASALEINITAGENYFFDLGESYEYYETTGNFTKVDLNITKNGTIVTVEINKYMKSDSFSLTFYKSKDEPVYSRGSSCKYNENFDWECSEWSTCANGTQTRICKEYNNCGGTYGKPNEIQSCLEEIGEDQEKDTEEEPAETEKGKFIIFYILCGVIILAIIFMWYRILKKQKEKDKEKKNDHSGSPNI